jgi:hypothetical protein
MKHSKSPIAVNGVLDFWLLLLTQKLHTLFNSILSLHTSKFFSFIPQILESDVDVTNYNTVIHIYIISLF